MNDENMYELMYDESMDTLLVLAAKPGKRSLRDKVEFIKHGALCAWAMLHNDYARDAWDYHDRPELKRLLNGGV